MQVYVAAQLVVLVPLFVAAATTRSRTLFLVGTTVSTWTTIVRLALFGRTSVGARAAALALPGVLSAVLAVLSLAFPGQPGLRESTFVAFTLSLLVSAAQRAYAEAQTNARPAPERVALHAWGCAHLLTIAALGVAVVAAQSSVAETAIICLVGFTPLAALLDDANLR